MECSQNSRRDAEVCVEGPGDTVSSLPAFISDSLLLVSQVPKVSKCENKVYLNQDRSTHEDSCNRQDNTSLLLAHQDNICKFDQVLISSEVSLLLNQADVPRKNT